MWSGLRRAGGLGVSALLSLSFDLCLLFPAVRGSPGSGMKGQGLAHKKTCFFPTRINLLVDAAAAAAAAAAAILCGRERRETVFER